MTKIENEIAYLLRQYESKAKKLLTIGTVESATGGRIGDKITNAPGSSDYYKGSIIAYSNEIKISIVGVKKETIETHGAVSPETAIEMAEGGKKLLKVDICISDTGIAGPTGATAKKPVGLFILGLSAEDATFSQQHRFTESREKNKKYATKEALNMIKEYLLVRLNKVGSVIPEEKHLVTCFLEHNNRILILKRSKRVGSYQGKWAGVSGYMKLSDIKQAFTEIEEETGLTQNDIILRNQGELIKVIDENLNRKWVIHPFLFHVKKIDNIKLDWEHTELKWIEPRKLTRYKTVPKLKEALDGVIL